MSTYAFRAVDLAGVPSRGVVDAETKSQVTEQLRERGLIVLDVSEKNEALRLESFLDRFRGIKTRDKAVFARQFATLVASGMPMLRSLYTLEDQTEDERFREAIVGVRQDVEAGSSLADAMERRPHIFDSLFRAMVRSGESSGRLEDSLDRVAHQLEKMDALKRQIRSAMMYPLFIFGAAILIMLAVVIFIVPVFADAFKEAVADQPGASADLPALTQVTIGISNFVSGYWFIWVPATIGATIGFIQWKKTTRGRGQWDRIKLRMPVHIGDIVRKVARGALVADLLGRRRRRCPHPAIDPARREDVGQCRGRRGDERDLRVRQGRGNHRAPDREERRLPADGGPHGLGG